MPIWPRVWMCICICSLGFNLNKHQRRLAVAYASAPNPSSVHMQLLGENLGYHLSLKTRHMNPKHCHRPPLLHNFLGSLSWDPHSMGRKSPEIGVAIRNRKVEEFQQLSVITGLDPQQYAIIYIYIYASSIYII